MGEFRDIAARVLDAVKLLHYYEKGVYFSSTLPPLSTCPTFGPRSVSARKIRYWQQSAAFFTLHTISLSFHSGFVAFTFIV